MSDPTNDRPLLTTDLTFCSICGEPSTAWAPGPLGAAEGRCAAHRESMIATVPLAEPACYLCHRPPGKGKRECRPYGPDGALLCAGCMFGEDGVAPDPAVQDEASRQFGALIDDASIAAGAGGIVVLDRRDLDAVPPAPYGVQAVKA